MFEGFFISHLGSQYVNAGWSVLSKLSEHFHYGLLVFQKVYPDIFFVEGSNRKLNQNQLYGLENCWGALNYHRTPKSSELL